jgi:hypothetical protein
VRLPWRYGMLFQPHWDILGCPKKTSKTFSLFGEGRVADWQPSECNSVEDGFFLPNVMSLERKKQ